MIASAQTPGTVEKVNEDVGPFGKDENGDDDDDDEDGLGLDLIA